MTGRFGNPHYPTPEEIKKLQKKTQSFLAGSLNLLSNHNSFEYLTVTRLEAAKMFIHSPFKLARIATIPETDPLTVYKCGSFVDLCRGPHLPSTKYIKSVLLTKIGSVQYSPTYPQNNMSRVYGISFTSHNLMRL